MGRLIIKFSYWLAMRLVLLISIGIGIGIGDPELSDSNYVNGFEVPFFYSGPENQTVMSGESVVMSCSVGKDNLQFGLHWLQSNRFLEVQDVREPIYWISPDNLLMGNYSLIIDNVTVDNTGEYNCVLVNGTGDLWEENLQIVRESPVASLEVVEPEPEPELTTTSHPQPQRSTESTPKGTEVIEPVLKPTKKDEGVPGNPPDLKIPPDDGDDSQLLYYILGGISVAVLVLVIILTTIFCKRRDCKFSCKSSDVEKSFPNPNYKEYESEASDDSQKESRIESD